MVNETDFFTQIITSTAIGKKAELSSEILHNKDKLENLRLLYNQCLQCQSCPLSLSRNNVVFGRGSVNARVMFIGEAPGAEEDKQAKPFVGRSGILLAKVLTEVGFKDDDYFISNVIKCRPPANRRPKIEEISNCRLYLQRQIELISPEILITLGATALNYFVDAPLKISELRGKIITEKQYNLLLMPTLHPAYILRCPSKKTLLLEDLKKVKNYLDSKTINN